MGPSFLHNLVKAVVIYHLLLFSEQLSVTVSVIIPDNYSEIYWHMAIDLVMSQAKFHVGGVRLIMSLDVICKIERVSRPTNVY